MQRPETKGEAKLSHGGRLLTIITTGKKASTTVYVVVNCNPDTAIADPAYNLYKPDGTHYSVHKDKFGVHCDCPDSHWVRAQNRQHCKHCRAMMAVGLIKQ